MRLDAMELGSKNVSQGAEDIDAAGDVLHKVKDDTERVGEMLTQYAGISYVVIDGKCRS